METSLLFAGLWVCYSFYTDLRCVRDLEQTARADVTVGDCARVGGADRRERERESRERA